MSTKEKLAKVTNKTALNKSILQKGNYTTTDKPSDFAGIWKGKERSLKKVRAKAWKRKA